MDLADHQMATTTAETDHHITSGATSPTQMEFVTSVPTVDVSGIHS